VLSTAAVLLILLLGSSPALAQTSTHILNTDAEALTRGLGFGVATPLALRAEPQATVQVNEADAGIGFGVIYGIVRPSFADEDAQFSVSNRTGYKFGIFFGGNRDGTVGFWGKLLYKVKKGAFFGETDDFELKYLEIPVGFRVNVGSPSRNSVAGFFDVGGIVDINIEKLDDANIPEDYLGTELGYYFGVGVEITRLIIELRWDRMVKSFYDPAGGFESIKGHEFEVEFMFRIN
jgi:hypothetical protein